MPEEPAIITILKADHTAGFHTEFNKYCPLCVEETLAEEVEDFLKSREGGEDGRKS